MVRVPPGSSPLRRSPGPGGPGREASSVVTEGWIEQTSISLFRITINEPWFEKAATYAKEIPIIGRTRK